MADPIVTAAACQPVLIGGQWRAAATDAVFHAENPENGEVLPARFPVSRWEDCDEALQAAQQATEQLRELPAQRRADFLRAFAERIEARRDALVSRAHAETGLPATPRLADIELPRTTSQLRQAAQAAEDGSWTHATLDTASNIRSWCAPLGPVAVFGPNNFPFAFGSSSGGDFAAAIAAGNPVIAKANSSHPGTTQLFAEAAFEACRAAGLPASTVQLLYRLGHDDGLRLVADPRLGATAYTGSRRAGLALKAAADRAGKPIYLELSSVNPVVILPGALTERGAEIAAEFTTSCLMGTGQFCTNPGLVLLVDGPETEAWISDVARRFAAAPAGTLLSRGVRDALQASVQTLLTAGAVPALAGPDHTGPDDKGPDDKGPDPGGSAGCGPGYRCPNQLLRIAGRCFCDQPSVFQTEAFGNASLLVVAEQLDQLCQILDLLEGSLTGCVYSAGSGGDDPAYTRVARSLRPRVGRLLNDKMPTGVAVSPAMNHGGPYPATGHPGFTAVGIPASLSRFAMLQCFDNVRPDRLPRELQDRNPNGRMWRLVDGDWTQADVATS